MRRPRKEWGKDLESFMQEREKFEEMTEGRLSKIQDNTGKWVYKTPEGKKNGMGYAK
jgi:hypothetical protein